MADVTLEAEVKLKPDESGIAGIGDAIAKSTSKSLESKLKSMGEVFSGLGAGAGAGAPGPATMEAVGGMAGAGGGIGGALSAALGPIGVILVAILAIVAIFKDGLKPLQDMLGAILKMISLLVMPIAMLLIPVLMPVLQVLGTFLKFMMMIFMPIFKNMVMAVQEAKAAGASPMGMMQAALVVGLEGLATVVLVMFSKVLTEMGKIINNAMYGSIQILITFIGGLAAAIMDAIPGMEGVADVIRAMTTQAVLGIEAVRLIMNRALDEGFEAVYQAFVDANTATMELTSGLFSFEGVILAIAGIFNADWAAELEAGFYGVRESVAGGSGLLPALADGFAEVAKKADELGDTNFANLMLAAEDLARSLFASTQEAGLAVTEFDLLTVTMDMVTDAVENLDTAITNLLAPLKSMWDYLSGAVGGLGGGGGGGGAGGGTSFGPRGVSIDAPSSSFFGAASTAAGFAANTAKAVSAMVSGSRQGGGDINETGLYMMHEGETVIPKGRSGGGGNITINMNAPFYGDPKAFAKECDKQLKYGLNRRSGYAIGQ